jgi:hypothetical protein
MYNRTISLNPFLNRVVVLSIFALLGSTAQSDELPISTLWQTDLADHQPSLEYPVRYMLFYHTLGIAVLGSMEKEHTNFSGPSFDNFLDGFRKGVRFDDDEWFFNYLAHPLWGSETYMRARSQGYTPLKSFLFSSACSVVWEFGFESPFQRPSSQDLLITSTVGSLLGELRFHLKRRFLENPSNWNLFLGFMVDPLQSATLALGRTRNRDWSEPAWRRIDISEQRRLSNFEAGIGIMDNRLCLQLTYSESFGGKPNRRLF